MTDNRKLHIFLSGGLAQIPCLPLFRVQCAVTLPEGLVWASYVTLVTSVSSGEVELYFHLLAKLW